MRYNRVSTKPHDERNNYKAMQKDPNDVLQRSDNNNLILNQRARRSKLYKYRIIRTEADFLLTHCKDRYLIAIQ